MKKLFTLIVLLTVIISSSFAQACGNLFNLQSPLDTATYYTAGTPGTDTGYLSGNNIYGDLAKAEGFAAVPGDSATSATFFFATVIINPSDSNNTIKAMVWDNTGASIEGNTDAPGNALDSATITLRQIAAAVTATINTGVITGVTVNFTGRAALTDSFYVGVILPTVTGDTVALFTNQVPPGPDRNGWEYEVNYMTGTGYIWGSYNDDWGFTGGSAGNYISVVICGAAPVAAFGYTETYGLKASDSLPCPLVTVNFSDSSTGSPSAWYWTFGDGDTSTSQNPVHFYNTGGNFTVKEVISGPNGVDSVSAVISIAAIPSDSFAVTEPTSGSNNGAVTLIVSGDSPYTYLWSNGDTTQTITGLTDSTYTVTITGGNGCQIISSELLYNVTGINSIHGINGVKIYPNPATDMLNLVWSQKSNADVAIIDLNGQVIGTFESVGEIKSVYDVHDLAAGTYVLRITNKASNQQQSTLFSKF